MAVAMSNMIRKMLTLLSSQERRNLGILTAIMTLNALVEVLGIASVAPLLAILTNPQSIEIYPFVSDVYAHFGFDSFQQLSIVLGGVIFLIILISNLTTLLANYLVLRYANNREYTIGWNLLKTYLHQPYQFFLVRHSMMLLRNVDNEVAYLISNVLTQGTMLVGRVISSLAIIAFIFFINPQVTIVMGLILGLAYCAIYFLTRRKMYTLGVERMAQSASKLRIITDSIRIIKDIKMLNAEQMFLDKFRKTSIEYSRTRTLSDTISIAPRYIIEIFAIAALVFAIIYLVSTKESATEVLPILGIYAFAGYRLLPALQQIFSALSKIQFSAQSLELIASEIKELTPLSEENKNHQASPLLLKQSFGLDNVHYSYDGKESVLKGISLNINKGERIGIIGSSGAGKSTLIDILVGLNSPTSGELTVDGQPVKEDSLIGWRSNIGYVSQNVYLLDDSINSNIALERDPTSTDNERLKLARSLSLVDDFAAEMEKTGRLTVGESGSNISGGQRQRVGIARALYRKADILVFDEATSALDSMTERKILENLHNKCHQTMIFITHRVETLRFCDRIYLLSDGKIVDSGPYAELIEKSPLFKQLIHSSGSNA